MLVIITVSDAGVVPTVTPAASGKARAIADEWRAGEQAALATIDARYGAVMRAKDSGQWVADFGAYLAGRVLLRQLNDARACQVHKTRMAKLAAIQTDATEARS
jgi:hypothetical protein